MENNKKLYEWFCGRKILDFIDRYRSEFGDTPEDFGADILPIDDLGFKMHFLVPDIPDFKTRLEEIVKQRPALNEWTTRDRMTITYMNDILKKPLPKNEVVISVDHKDSGFLFKVAKKKYDLVQAQKSKD
ncbi:hypothetical protein GF358_02245 [Candidatus Woesearchaeota archaeon]|nr:hypothetical protein [Candidatus Woesearchaeota archaeon]